MIFNLKFMIKKKRKISNQKFTFVIKDTPEKKKKTLRRRKYKFRQRFFKRK